MGTERLWLCQNRQRISPRPRGYPPSTSHIQGGRWDSLFPVSGKEIEGREETYFSRYAALSADSRGRLVYEEPCQVRTDYQRDREQIIHSKSFRRLKHKTQVFSPGGDHVTGPR